MAEGKALWPGGPQQIIGASGSSAGFSSLPKPGQSGGGGGGGSAMDENNATATIQVRARMARVADGCLRAASVAAAIATGGCILSHR